MERRRRALRLAVQRAAVDLFEEHGVEAVTVEQIARAAGISSRTFYRCCPTKEDAATCHVSTSAEDLVAAVRRSPGTTLFRAVQQGALAVLAAVGVPALDHRRTVAVSLEQAPLRARWAAGSRELQHQLAEVVAGQPLGEGTARAEVLAGVAVTALTTALEHWALDGGQLADHLADCFGVVGPLDVQLPPLHPGG